MARTLKGVKDHVLPHEASPFDSLIKNMECAYELSRDGEFYLRPFCVFV